MCPLPHGCSLELPPDPNERPLDVDLDLDFLFVGDVEIPVAGIYLGGDIPHLEAVADRADELVGFVDVVHVPATPIAPQAEDPTLREIPEGVQADKGGVETYRRYRQLMKFIQLHYRTCKDVHRI